MTGEDVPPILYSAADVGRIVLAWAVTEPFIRRVYLFGSRARGDNHPFSDVDLAVLTFIAPAELAAFTGDGSRPKAEIAAQLAAMARCSTYNENVERWQASLAEMFDVPVQLESPLRFDRTVRPSLKRCRVLLFTRR